MCFSIDTDAQLVYCYHDNGKITKYAIAQSTSATEVKNHDGCSDLNLYYINDGPHATKPILHIYVTSNTKRWVDISHGIFHHQ